MAPVRADIYYVYMTVDSRVNFRLVNIHLSLGLMIFSTMTMLNFKLHRVKQTSIYNFVFKGSRDPMC